MELVVGRIGRPHGIRGEVTVEVRTDSPEIRFAPGAKLRTDPSAAGPLVVEGAHWPSGRLLRAFAGVTDRNGAEALRNVKLVIEVSADDRPDDDEEFYDHQLVGLAVHTVSGGVVGTVAEVLHLPSQELLAVRTPDDGEVLVPFVTQIVPEIDLDAGVVRIDPPPGLLEVGEPASRPDAALEG
ncbi:MAG: ribosome maturation factor RimM [Sporichthyaceae bacterium]